MSELKFVRIIRPDGRVYDFGESFVESNIGGAGGLTREIYSEPRGIGHGNIITGSRIPPRELTIEADTMFTDDGTKRAELDAFFCYPEDDHRIEITYKGRTRWITGQIEIFDLPLDYVGAPQRFELSVICADPLFKSMDYFGKDIAQITGYWGFPIYSPIASDDPYVTVGNITGIYDFSKQVFLPNDGDFYTFPLVEVIATDNVVDFEIFRSDKEFVRLDGPDSQLKNGDHLVIDFAEEIITRNGININQLINRNSTFFMIDRGGTTIQYKATQGDNSVRVSIYYYKQYKDV